MLDIKICHVFADLVILKVNRMMTEFSFPQLIVVPLSCHEVDGVRKEKERLTAAQRLMILASRGLSLSFIKLESKNRFPALVIYNPIISVIMAVGRLTVYSRINL